MTPTPVMRAGDADREVVAEILRTALGEGRLDLHEVDERPTRTYAARTYAELEPIVADLPRGPSRPAGRSSTNDPVVVRMSRFVRFSATQCDRVTRL